MPSVLVTGFAGRLDETVVALKTEGFDTVAAMDQSDLEHAGHPAQSIDCYLQLAATPPPSGPTALARARCFLTGELPDRIDAAARALPLLAPRAVVMLVGPEGSGAALSQLAQALMADHRADRLRAEVVTEALGPADLAALARRLCRRTSTWEAVSGIAPRMPFAEWRDEIVAGPAALY